MTAAHILWGWKWWWFSWKGSCLFSIHPKELQVALSKLSVMTWISPFFSLILTFPPKVALEVYTQHEQPQASQVQQQSFRKVTERNSSGQQLRISVGLLVSKNRRMGGWGGRKEKKKEERKKERAVGAGSTVFQTTCTLRRVLSHLLLETELGGLEPPAAGWPPTPVSARSAAARWARQPRLTCGLCVPGPPSASVPPEQLLPGPNPVKMESSSGPLRFCSWALNALLFSKTCPWPASLPQPPMSPLQFLFLLIFSGVEWPYNVVLVCTGQHSRSALKC